MSDPKEQPHKSHHYARLAFFTAFNLLNVVLVGRGMILLSMDAVAGYFWVPMGTLGVIALTWLQENDKVMNSHWNRTWPISILIGVVAVGSFFRMVNPYL